MNTKNFFLRVLPIAIIISLILAFIVWYFTSSVTIKIMTPKDEITTFVYNSKVIQSKDYQMMINKIECMRFSKQKTNPQSREMDLYIYLKDSDGVEEVIGCNDNLITHTYNNEIVEKYKIPLITQFYIKAELYHDNGDVRLSNKSQYD